MAELSKEEFCGIINRMTDNFKACMEINENLKKINGGSVQDCFDGEVLLGPYEDTVIHLLEIIMNDTDGWIRYFSEDYGTGYCHNDTVVFGRDGKEHNLNCVETLWELLHLTK